MKDTTRYYYEKRIKVLEWENNQLRDYRRVMKNIYAAIAEVVGDGKSINTGWILKQIGELLK